MKTLIIMVLIFGSYTFAYELYDPSSGGTIYVKWCDPVKDELNNLKYIQCGDSSDKKIPFYGLCSNLQSDCGHAPPAYPVQTGGSKNGKLVNAKKKWEYFNLNQAAKVGYPGTYKPASIEVTAEAPPTPPKKSSAKKAIKKP
ncbi:MAG: hypothetical protein A4S09_15015 [Proteobacteria bacterium SG_bin7]|nr:MAG: hypothetical protein A4S09_15015 [Proteobacteria bacterium SG_bin7]